MKFFDYLKIILNLPKNISIYFIKIYQKFLSPDHGFFKNIFPHGYCRFTPTCSEYGIQAIEKYGFVKGWSKAIWRIIRCNPFNKGGYDPLK